MKCLKNIVKFCRITTFTRGRRKPVPFYVVSKLYIYTVVYTFSSPFAASVSGHFRDLFKIFIHGITSRPLKLLILSKIITKCTLLVMSGDLLDFHEYFGYFKEIKSDNSTKTYSFKVIEK